MITVPGLDAHSAYALAVAAVRQAQSIAPKNSGRGASRLQPYYGAGFFGIRWGDAYMWFQESGVKPFTMRSLAGKLIPMWVDDRDGSEARKLAPKDRQRRTRTTASGKHQVLIFRKVAAMGARKNKTMPSGAVRSVPASYPGAPGRIASRQVLNGASTGRIASRTVGMPHVGVRWRFPGLVGRGFMAHSLTSVASAAGLGSPPVQHLYQRA